MCRWTVNRAKVGEHEGAGLPSGASSPYGQNLRAFHAQLPALLEAGKSGQFTLFHNGQLVRSLPDRDELYRMAEVDGLPMDDVNVDLICSDALNSAHDLHASISGEQDR